MSASVVVTENHPEPKPKTGKVDVDKAVELRLKGCSYGDIAKYFKCDKALVVRKVKPIVGPVEQVDVFKRHRADLLAGVQKRILSSITDEDIKSAPLNARSTTFGILYDKERLERNLSTENVEVIDHAEVEKLRILATRMAKEKVSEAIDVTPVEVPSGDREQNESESSKV